MNKKIACCISGYPSTKILDHLNNMTKYKNDVDFFIFFWDVINDELKRRINSIIQPKDIVYIHPIQFQFDAIFKEPDKSGSKNDALSMFYGISYVQQLRKSYSDKNKINYDIIIRYRYDIHFITDFNKILNDVKNNLCNNTIIFPYEHHHIGLCDQLWFGDNISMNKFINLFQWIKDNIRDLLFINENVLYQFVSRNDISYKCIDMQYILRRDGFINYNDMYMIGEYNRQKILPWILSCPEKMNGKYQKYICDKNKSANTIFFLTNCNYKNISKCFFNIDKEKFICINNKNSTLIPIGSVNSTKFNIQIYDSTTIVLALNGFSDKTVYFSCKDKQPSFTEDVSNMQTHFFINKIDNYFIIIHYIQNEKNNDTLNTSYLSMNNFLGLYFSDIPQKNSRWLLY